MDRGASPAGWGGAVTARTDDIARRFGRATADLRTALADVAALDRYAPDEVDTVVAALREWAIRQAPRVEGGASCK